MSQFNEMEQMYILNLDHFSDYMLFGHVLIGYYYCFLLSIICKDEIKQETQKHTLNVLYRDLNQWVTWLHSAVFCLQPVIKNSMKNMEIWKVLFKKNCKGRGKIRFKFHTITEICTSLSFNLIAKGKWKIYLKKTEVVWLLFMFHRAFYHEWYVFWSVEGLFVFLKLQKLWRRDTILTWHICGCPCDFSDLWDPNMLIAVWFHHGGSLRASFYT